VKRPVWYADGLQFACTRCGTCCTGEPGYVWVNREELRDIAEYLGLPLVQCRAMHARPRGRRTLLREKSNGDCTFWEQGAGCEVYPVRPAQCRSYPFWPENLVSWERWEVEAEHCPGIGRGRRYRAEEIIRIRRGEIDVG